MDGCDFSEQKNVPAGPFVAKKLAFFLSDNAVLIDACLFFCLSNFKTGFFSALGYSHCNSNIFYY